MNIADRFDIDMIEIHDESEDLRAAKENLARVARSIPVPISAAADDPVNHPNHYTVGDIEVIDYIRDKLTPAGFQGYCIGNVLKYVSRWEHKGGVQDLKKAQVYLNWAIESVEGEETK